MATSLKRQIEQKPYRYTEDTKRVRDFVFMLAAVSTTERFQFIYLTHLQGLTNWASRHKAARPK